MDNEIVNGLVYFGLGMAVIGSLIAAVLHSFGFLIFGYKDIRPSFVRRWLMSFFSGIIVTLICFILGNNVDTTALMATNMIGMIISFILIIVAINHLSLSAVTYFIFSAKGNMGAALKTPIFITVLLLAIYLIPSIYLFSNMPKT